MSFTDRYRPTSFSQVVGQDAAVAALKRLKEPKCIMLHGPTGCGKTTLARIVARELLGCEEPEEVNGSDKTGVDAWREVIEAQAFAPLGGQKRVIIIDECHKLSDASWSVLLKPMEEPPEGWHWILCTTEPNKVLKATRTRCKRVQVNPLRVPGLEEVLRTALDGECLDPSKGDLAQRVKLVARAADGCPRDALEKFEMIQDVPDLDQVRLLLGEEGDQDDNVVRLCKLILDGGELTWPVVLKLVGKPTNDQAEGLRKRICQYLATVVFNGNGKEHVLGALECFSERYPHETARAGLAVSLGALIYGSEDGDC